MARKLAIFDLDGTLIDSRRDIADAGNAARIALGLHPLTVSEIQDMIGDGASKLIERLTPSASSGDRHQAMAAFRSDYANRLTSHTKPYKGVPELLHALRTDGWQLAVATNKPTEFAQLIMDRLALKVDALRGGDGIPKPDPHMLFDLMDTLSAHPRTTWMIGDHHTDLAAARRAGITSIWCPWGFGHQGDELIHLEASSPADILTILTHG